jgi:hypothetical protein
MADQTITGTLSVTEKVGIRTDNPSPQLHIASPAGDPSEALIESSGVSLKLTVNATGASIGTTNAFPLSIQTGGSAQIAITPAGSVTVAGPLTIQSALTATSNVIIGTDTTPATLEVKGNIQGRGATLTGPLTIQNVLTVTGNVNINTGKLQVSGGAITPAAGNSESAGILFPTDPGGGSGDAAWIRYYPRIGENCTLEIGASNDLGDHIALMSSGNVGIGTIDPQAKLDVRGGIFAGNSDIYFTKTDHNHTGVGNAPGFAAIENAADYDALMILGRAGTAKGRSVKLWDYLQVNGDLEVTGNISGRVAGIGFASASLSHGQSIPVPTGFTRQECVFLAAIKLLSFGAGETIFVNCTVDKDGKVSIDPEGKAIVTGFALAKKGGW